ncbi:MAG TPA: hypothetical protein VIH00_00240 [Candidatus Limnocylindrales bacterium]
MATKSTTETIVVLESFIGLVDGAERVFRKGDLIRPNDPAVSKWPDFFGPATFRADRVEQATAAPGEQRG